MKHLAFAAGLAVLAASSGSASTSSSAFGSASVMISAYTLDDYDEVALVVSGRTSVSASAFVNAPNGRSAQSDSATVTFKNPLGIMLELNVELIVTSQSATEFLDGVIVTAGRYDSNAYVTLGTRSKFTSTNGSYSCSDGDYASLSFDCYGVFQDDYEELFETPLLYLNPFESITYELEATAFAFIESEVAPVPVPAGVALLMSALGWLALGTGLARRAARSLKMQSCIDA